MTIMGEMMKTRLAKITVGILFTLLTLIHAFIKGGFRWWFFLAATASWLGEMTLSEYRPAANWTRRPFTGGSALLAAGNLAWAIGLAFASARIDTSAGVLWIGLLVLWALAAAFILWMLLPNPAFALSAKIGAGAYLAAACLAAAIALGIAARNPSFWPMAVGGILGVASSALLGIGPNDGRRAQAGDIARGASLALIACVTFFL